MGFILPSMKLLTATTTGQGERSNDVSRTIEGELVGIDEPCATDARNPDGRCGCGRAFFGLSSHRPTTTDLVRDLPLTRDDLARALVGFHASSGDLGASIAETAPDVDELIVLGSLYAVGTVVERRLDIVRCRLAVR